MTTRTKLINTKPIEKPFCFLSLKKLTTKDNPNSIIPNMVIPFTISYLSYCFIFFICSNAISEILHLANVK